MKELTEGIDWLIEKFRNDQDLTGAWNYPFETGITTDAYTIVLLRSLEIEDEAFIFTLTQRILQKQEKNGAWKLIHDEEEGNLSLTVEAYYSLLYSGYYSKEDPELILARDFILEKGGLEEIRILSKVMLAITGQYAWPAFSPLPLEFILLPLSFPINFYSISVFGRSNLAPTLILSHLKYVKRTDRSPDLTDLYLHRYQSEQWIRSSEMRSILSYVEKGIKNLLGAPEKLHQLAIEQAEKYMLEHIEADGTLYSYFGATYLMIFALLALGYSKDDPLIRQSIEGIRSMKCEIDGFPHMQYTTASVWNTALIGYVLQEAGITPKDPMVTKANQYLLSKQHTKKGDWAVHNPIGLPGGWGFSTINSMNPDVDDTCAALRSILSTYHANSEPWDKGIQWILSMQNKDGGWPAFEKEVQSTFAKFLPIDKGDYLFSDPSCADITGRLLEFFGNYTHQPKHHSSIKNAIKWLLKHQEENGSWYGRWGICYIYGTWAALTGLHAVGLGKQHTAIKKAENWLIQIQNSDGGWGESCHSDDHKRYIPLGKSHLTQTAWAVDALIAVSDQPTLPIKKGMRYLLDQLKKEDWSFQYPTGQGIPGLYYIHYHSYRYIFPLLAFAHYKKKYHVNADLRLS